MKREEDIRSEHSVRLSPPSEGLGEVLTFRVSPKTQLQVYPLKHIIS